MLIAVAGCVAQAEGGEIRRRAPFVDLVFGPQTYHRLPELVARALQAGGRGVVDTSFPEEPKFDHLPQARTEQGVSAFVTVQEGCDKFCTFCVVPYTRGAEYSRPAAQILDEARRLLALGARELTLLGQNVNAYHGEGPDGREWGLGDLVRALAEIPGLERIRYTTSHPRDVDERLIAAHRDVPQLMPFLHLPVQSGSDYVLAAMNRRHTAADYQRIVERLRAARPDLALSTDLIVGFPGESDDDFRATIDLVSEIGFAQAFSFKYSPRPGTPAASAAGSGRGNGQGRAARRVADAAGAAAARLQRSLRRARPAGAVGKAGAAPRSAGRPQPLPAERPSRRCRRPGWRCRPGPDIGCRSKQPLRDGCGMTAPPSGIIAAEPAEGRTQLEFDDNLLLPPLYGERDQHLDRIERQLGVSVVTRGNRLAISGPPSATEAAQLALSRLYDRLKHGQEIDLPAVEAAIRLAEAEIADRSLSLWHEDAAFRTRKRRIAARSPGQAAYIKALRESDWFLA